MLFLIVGRTGRGKDHLKGILQSMYGWNFVKSYTTRPKRSPDEDTHIFISKEEADSVPKDSIVAYTQIGEYVYFVTKGMLKGADAYIIDPNGVEYLRGVFPNERFHVIYIKAAEDEAEKRAIMRGIPEIEKERFKARTVAEGKEFSDFERFINSADVANSNLVVDTFFNDYTEGCMQRLANEMQIKKLGYPIV